MAIYQLQESGYKKALPRVIATSAVMYVGIIAYLIYLSFTREVTNPSFSGFGWIICLLLAAMAFSTYRVIQTHRKNWLSFRLHMDADSMTRQHRGIPDMTLSRNEITSIEESVEGNITIRTNQKTRIIFIPAGITESEKLREKLASFGPISAQTQPSIFKKYPLILTIGMLGFMAIYFSSTTKWVILSSGIILLAILVWSMITMIRYRHLLTRPLQLVMFIYPLFILGISYRLLYTAGLVGNAGGDTFERYIQQGERLLREEKYGEAILYLDSAIVLQPDRSYLYSHRADAKIRIDDFEGAIADYSMALDRNPTSAHLFSERAYAKYILADHVGALAELKLALQQDNKYVNAYLYRGYVKQDQKDLKGAEQDYSQVLSLEADNLNAYINRAQVRIESGNQAGACEDWKKQIELGDESVQDSIAKYCTR